MRFSFYLLSRPSFHLSIRSTLPVGAGLGSSAAFSSCVSSAILLVNKRITPPPYPKRSRAPSRAGDPGHIHLSHQGRRALPPTIANEVNKWAFVAEKILHGNPSGVDNAVVVFGGALAYTKPGFGSNSGMDPIQGCVTFLCLRLSPTSPPQNLRSCWISVFFPSEREGRKGRMQGCGEVPMTILIALVFLFRITDSNLSNSSWLIRKSLVTRSNLSPVSPQRKQR